MLRIHVRRNDRLFPHTRRRYPPAG